MLAESGVLFPQALRLQRLTSDGKTEALVDETTLRATNISVIAADTSQQDLLANAAVETAGFGASGGLIFNRLRRDVLALTSGGGMCWR